MGRYLYFFCLVKNSTWITWKWFIIDIIDQILDETPDHVTHRTRKKLFWIFFSMISLMINSVIIHHQTNEKRTSEEETWILMIRTNSSQSSPSESGSRKSLNIHFYRNLVRLMLTRLILHRKFIENSNCRYEWNDQIIKRTNRLKFFIDFVFH